MLWSKAPFDESARGDCILQSSDQIHFKVHKVVLSLASSIFDDMFNIPQPSPSTEEPTTLPVITLDEDENILFLLLAHIHPSRPPHYVTEDLDLAIKLFDACNKYFIERPEEVLTKLKYDEKLLLEDPARWYATAWISKVGRRVKIASRYMHDLDLQDPVTRSKLTLNGRNFEPLLALHEFRERREQALDGLLQALPIPSFLCANHCTTSALVGVSVLLRQHLRNAVKTPHILLGGTQAFLPRINGQWLPRASNDSICSSCPGVQLGRFTAISLAATETALAQFPCEIEW